VWKKGHKESDHSNPDKLCNPVEEARLVNSCHTFVAFSLLLVLSHLQFPSPCRKSIRTKGSNSTVKTSTGRMSPLTAKLPMPAGVEKHMDVEIRFLFNFVNARYDILPMFVAFLRYALFNGVVDSREALSPRGSSSSQSSNIMPHVSQINLNYEVMENQLKAMQGTLTVEQE
jgi:hypothetical protein